MQVDIRGKLLNARVVKPPFVRNGPRAGRTVAATQFTRKTKETRAMSNVPADLKYARSHEWVRSRPTAPWRSASAIMRSSALGDLVFVEVPEVGRTLQQGEACAVVESVKAASDVYAPVAGTVVDGQRGAGAGAGADQPGSLRRRLDHAAQAQRGAGRSDLLNAEAYAALAEAG